MLKGSGRGRGWLNLGKSKEPPCPGIIPVKDPEPIIEPEVSEVTRKIIKQIKLLNEADDGILFNLKMKSVQKYWSELCVNTEEVERSCAEVYTYALFDTDLAIKLMSLLSIENFVKHHIHDVNFRHQFIRRLQDDFEDSNQLYTSGPPKFRNMVQMLGALYNKVQRVNSKAYSFLPTPILTCLEFALSNRSLPDLKLLAEQLHKNGSSLQECCADEVGKLGITVREILHEDAHLDPESKLWLLLILDLFSSKFSFLPNDIFKFYENHLGINEMVKFQAPQNDLNIDIVYTSKILDSYQSDVNVLQLSTKQEPAIPESKKNNKPGRPILGVGARFISDNGEKSGSKHSFHSRSFPKPVKEKKGYEHDDRFDNDYS